MESSKQGAVRMKAMVVLVSIIQVFVHFVIKKDFRILINVLDVEYAHDLFCGSYLPLCIFPAPHVYCISVLPDI